MAPAAKPATRKKARNRAREKARGALATIGALLIASAVIRAATGAGEAFAREGDAEQVQPSAPVEISEDGQSQVRIKRMTEPDFQGLLELLEEREARVEKRELELAIRMKALAVAEEEIQKQLAEMKNAEDRLRQTLSLAQGASERDVEQLTEVYANMKPKQAAALFQEMEPEFAAGFLARMRPDAAAAIMAGLDPRIAYSVSVTLAGRHANVPKE